MRLPLLLAFSFFTAVLPARNQPINPIIGDQGYIMKFGEVPNEQTNDQVRISAHLQYAEYLLRTADVSALPTAQREKREHLLDLLHDYWTRGAFPRNDDYTGERRPCFIDHEGTICAVGYLVEQTAGREAAELISERFLYEEILEMNDPLVMEWIANSGLTAEEFAIIQPSYGPRFAFTWNASYGASFRLGDNVYHTFGIYRMKYRNSRGYGGGKYGSAFASGGIRFDYLNNGNFSLGVRYSHAVAREGYGRSLGHLAIMPECFRYNNTWGMNIKPEYEIGRTWKFLDLRLGYSYAIPVISESVYGAGRHDVTLRMMVNLSEIHIKIPKRKKTDDPPPGA
jgi:hypothetical protein